ncbi:MAG: sigma-70 family RNA polymerase sigma factor [Blastocatellia bacterium]
MASASTITDLLHEIEAGNRAALDELFPLVYEELRRLASSYLRGERSNHTLQATALVHEAWLRMVNQREADWHNRAQFFGLAAQMMRRILVNYANQHHAQKRGGYETRLALDEAIGFAATKEIDVQALDAALQTLAEIDEAQSRIVELRFFGGLTVAEVAEVMQVSPETIKRKWRAAKAFLFTQLR